MRPHLPPIPDLSEDLERLVESLDRDLSSRNVMRVAEALWRAGHPDGAIELLVPLTERDRSAIAPYVLLGWCYEDAGRIDDADAALAIVHDLDPANPYGRPRTAAEEPETSGGGEREAEPEDELTEEEMREIPPGPLYSRTLGRIFEKQGFEEKAREIYARVEDRDAAAGPDAAEDRP